MSRVVEILNPNARTISGVSKKTGGDYSFKVQEAYLHSSEGYPEKFEITLQDGASPYGKGFYDLAPDSVYIDRQGKLAISPKLVTAAVAPSAVAGVAK
jgi:hypothetical protein